MKFASKRPSHLQAILDNVKDAIVTVDDVGHIETFNPTGERIFGFHQAEILGRTLDFILPELRAQGRGDYLERLATKIDDTHVDLAAHPNLGPHQGRLQGLRWKLPSARQRMNRRDGYIVLRARHHGAPSRRTLDARKRGALPHLGRARPGSHRRIRLSIAAHSST